MNVTDPLFPPTGSHAPAPNSAISSQTAAMSTGQGRVVTALAAAAATATPASSPAASNTSVSSNQHFWNVSLYLEIALPLAATTIILPLVIGSIVRAWVQTAYRYRLYWRLLSGVGALAYLGLVYGFLFWFSDDPCDYHFSDCPAFWYYSRSYAAFVAYVVLVPGVLGSIAIWALYRAVRIKRRRSLWATFAVLVVASVFAELFIDYAGLSSWGFDTNDNDANGWGNFLPVPLTWIPWVFLIGTWIWDINTFRFLGKASIGSAGFRRRISTWSLK